MSALARDRAVGVRLLAWLAAGLGLLLVQLLTRPALHETPTLHAALVTMLALLPVVAAGLMLAHCRHQMRVDNLLLAGAVTAIAWFNTVVVAAPVVLELNQGGQFAAAGLWGSAFVGATFAIAAFMPPHLLVTRLRHPLAVAVVGSAAVIGVAELAGFALRSHLLDAGNLGAVTRRDTFSHVLTLVLVLAAISAWLVAAVGFARQRTRGTALVVPLAWAAGVLAAGNATSLFVGVLPADMVSPRSELRSVAYALILYVAIRQELESRRQLARATALAERRRVARDLHDGLAQDLAFIAAHTPRMAAEMGKEHPVVLAARRALAISRGAISDLANPQDMTTADALSAVAAELGERFELDIGVRIEGHTDPPMRTREDLTRIAREAVANAARHGHAGYVVLTVNSNSAGTRLSVVDDGTGIPRDAEGGIREGFGLRSIRERVETLGGEMRISEGRHGGTELEVVIP